VQSKPLTLKLTSEHDDENLHLYSGIGKKWFEDISKKLRSGVYKYKLAKKIYIPKGFDSQGSKPLNVGSPKDKIIQQAFRRVIEPIYEGISSKKKVTKLAYNNRTVEVDESKNLDQLMKGSQRHKKPNEYYSCENVIPRVFLNYSHGFRKNRSVHTAIKPISYIWTPLTFIVSFDIRRTFDNLNYHVLIKQLERKINDYQVIDEL
jgi:retron-type reverse transcriptase